MPHCGETPDRTTTPSLEPDETTLLYCLDHKEVGDRARSIEADNIGLGVAQGEP